MKYYLNLYLRIFLFYVKSTMEYRLNFVLKIFYGPAYTLTLFFLLALAYSQTNQLVGWTKDEAYLLFSVFHLMYTICIILFVESIKYYLWEGFRNGSFDIIMVKPANTQFLATFFRPEINLLPQAVGLLVFFIRQLVVLKTSIFAVEFLSFTLSMLFAFCIMYLFLSTVMTLGFYVTKAAQMYEFFDKTTDNAQYPMPLFPMSFQYIFFTILPIAFFSYLPTSILLGKSSPLMVFLCLGCALIFFALNRFAWKQALKHYSSASS